MAPAKRPRRRRAARSTVQGDLHLEVARFIRTYVVMTDAQAQVIALWTIHTHCFEVFQQTPYLSVTSPEKGCGKSRLLEVLQHLVCNPWMAITPSEAVLYRYVHFKRPTLLLDEVDTIFNLQSHASGRYEGHRAILNAGHRRGSRVPRCVGQDQQIQEFSVFCPKVLAGIGGNVPDTVADRSLPIRLERKKPDEVVRRWRRREAEPVAVELREKIEEWIDQVHPGLAEARPALPDALSDRMQEGCEPLVAIAEALGHGDAARAALVELLATDRLDDQESIRLRLLADIRTIFEDRERTKRVRGIHTSTLLGALMKIEESPWSHLHGREIEARDLANLLRPYGVRPESIRLGEKVQKGYRRDKLADAWERYLPTPPPRSRRNRRNGKPRKPK